MTKRWQWSKLDKQPPHLSALTAKISRGKVWNRIFSYSSYWSDLFVVHYRRYHSIFSLPSSNRIVLHTRSKIVRLVCAHRSHLAIIDNSTLLCPFLPRPSQPDLSTPYAPFFFFSDCYLSILSFLSFFFKLQSSPRDTQIPITLLWLAELCASSHLASPKPHAGH